jgi:hypothetical protein
LDGKLDGTVFAIAVDKNAPSSRTYLPNTARDAVVGQAKNRSPVHLLTRFRTRPHERFRLGGLLIPVFYMAIKPTYRFPQAVEH